MLPELTSEEVRVLGCLIEKEATTPDGYPLTVNSLVNACNQTSNRYPVVDYDDRTVLDALHELRERGLIRVVHSVHNRAIKYRHVVDEAFALDRRQLALLGVLLLRGPQTTAELRTRTERYCTFADQPDAENELDWLARPDPDPEGRPRRDPLVVKLARQAGQKEPRFSHLLAGPPDLSDVSQASEPGTGAWTSAATGAPVGRASAADRISALEQEVQQLRDELAAVRAGLEELRRLFD
jgi:uncharacterized protein YceH (UPF0502 family)